MNRAFAVRFLALYAPAVAAIALVYLRPLHGRLFPAALLGFLWTLPTLLAVQLLNLHFGWWEYRAQSGMFRGMPVDLYLGWAVLWGIVPVLAFRRLKIPAVVAIFFAFDLVTMPACSPVVLLGSRWLIGEIVSLAFVLAPAIVLARLTLSGTHVRIRAALQAAIAGGIFLFLVPELIFALRPLHAWAPLLAEPSWLRGLELQAIFLLAIPGLSAVQEFALRGFGTPIPYDPPQRLVASGLYRYIANPMQFSCTVVLLAWGIVLRHPYVFAAGVISFIYSFGIARWDEGADLESRFCAAWLDYRKHVPSWRFRLTPWHPADRPSACLYVAEACGPCSQVRRWFQAHHPIALEILAAEDFPFDPQNPTGDLERITYDPMDGTPREEGVVAFARALEHLNLGYAYSAAAIRLPLVSHLIQLLLDASGLGPTTIPRRQPSSASSSACSLPPTA